MGSREDRDAIDVNLSDLNVRLHFYEHVSHQLPEHDSRLDLIIVLLQTLTDKAIQMNASVSQLEAEIVDLKSNMTGLHAGISDIQKRLSDALAAAGAVVPEADLADLHTVNADLKAVVDGLAPPPPPAP